MRPLKRRIAPGGAGQKPALWMTMMALVLFAVSPLYAQGSQGDAIQRGVHYLLRARDADGTWSADAESESAEKQIVDTLAAILALDELSRSGHLHEDVATGGIGVLSIDANASDHVKLSQRLKVSLLTGASASTEFSALLEAQNSDGGWGISRGKESNFIDSVEVIDALIGVRPLSVPAGQLESARAYLESTQVVQTGGAVWQVTNDESPSDVVLAARGLIALDQIGNAQQRRAPSAQQLRAREYLLSRVDGNDLTSMERAYVLLALAGRGQPADIEPLVTALATDQVTATDANGRPAAADGSWDGDVFTTALVLRAMRAASPPGLGPLPDLLVRSSDIRYDAGSHVIEVVVLNTGSEPATSNVCVDLFDGQPRAGARKLTSLTIVPGPGGISIPAGGSRTVRLDATLFEDDSPVQVGVFVDAPSLIEESNEANNVAVSELLAIQPLFPDLAITADDLIVMPSATGWVLSARVRSLGAAVDPAEVTVTFQVTGQSSVSPTNGLPDGAPYTWDMAGLQPDQVYTVTATVAVADDIDNGNDSASLSFTAAADLPDLVVQSLRYLRPGTSVELAPSVLTFGQVVDIEVTVGNTGTADSTACELRAAEGDPRSLASNQETFSTGLAAIPASSAAVVLLESVLIPYGGRSGSNWEAVLGIWVDSDQANTESDEANNVTSYLIQRAAPSPLPDLAILPGSLRPSTTDVNANPTVRLMAAVCNLGETELAGADVQFAFSLDNQSTFVPIGTVTTGPVPPGESLEVTMFWMPPTNQPVAVGVRGDPVLSAPELTTANNTTVVDDLLFSSTEISLTLLPDDTLPHSNPNGLSEAAGGVYHARDPRVCDAVGALEVFVAPAGRIPPEGTRTYLPFLYLRPLFDPEAGYEEVQAVNPLNVGDFAIAWERLGRMQPGAYELLAEIWVVDSEPGLPPEEQRKLFGSITRSFHVGPTVYVAGLVPAIIPDVLERRRLDEDSVEVDPFESLQVQVNGIWNVSFETPLTYAITYYDSEPPSPREIPLTNTSTTFNPNQPFVKASLPVPPASEAGLHERGHYVLVASMTVPSSAGDPFAPTLPIAGQTSFDVEDPASLRLLPKIVEFEPVAPRDGERIRVRIRVQRGEQ